MASKIKVDQLETVDGTGNITVNQPLSGSGAGLTSLPAANITGVIPPANLGTGTASSSTFLNGSGAYSEAGGGAWILIGTQVASNSASLTITGLDSTYDTYAMAFSDMKPASATSVWIRVGDSGGVDSGAGDYSYFTSTPAEGSDTYYLIRSQAAAEIKLANSIGNGTGEGFGGMYYLHRPSDGTMQPIISGTGVHVNSSSELQSSHTAARREAVITLDRIQFLFQTGNITSGRMTVWGIAHA